VEQPPTAVAVAVHQLESGIDGSTARQGQRRDQHVESIGQHAGEPVVDRHQRVDDGGVDTRDLAAG